MTAYISTMMHLRLRGGKVQFSMCLHTIKHQDMKLHVEVLWSQSRSGRHEEVKIVYDTAGLEPLPVQYDTLVCYTNYPK
jgi:hypothetical protein